jgi:hypothetical protein
MDAKVQIQIAGNSVTVEGSEQFVKDQIDVFYEFCSSDSSEEVSDASSLETTHMTPKSAQIESSKNVREFFSQFSPDKPSESALVLAGWIYTQRGSSPFDISELKSLFDEVGAPSSQHLDMTIRNMQRDTKKYFQSVAGGLWRPTVPCENYFKTEMKLTAGSVQEK